MLIIILKEQFTPKKSNLLKIIQPQAIQDADEFLHRNRFWERTKSIIKVLQL